MDTICAMEIVFVELPTVKHCLLVNANVTNVTMDFSSVKANAIQKQNLRIVIISANNLANVLNVRNIISYAEANALRNVPRTRD